MANQPTTRLNITILPSWEKIFLRMQSAARRAQAPGVLTIKILIDDSGHPVAWSEPRLSKLEPKNTAIQSILDTFSS